MNKLILLALVALGVACSKPEMEAELPRNCYDQYRSGPFATFDVPEGHFDQIEDGVMYVCRFNSTGHCERRWVFKGDDYLGIQCK